MDSGWQNWTLLSLRVALLGGRQQSDLGLAPLAWPQPSPATDHNQVPRLQPRSHFHQVRGLESQRDLARFHLIAGCDQYYSSTPAAARSVDADLSVSTAETGMVRAL